MASCPGGGGVSHAPGTGWRAVCPRVSCCVEQAASRKTPTTASDPVRLVQCNALMINVVVSGRNPAMSLSSFKLRLTLLGRRAPPDIRGCGNRAAATAMRSTTPALPVSKSNGADDKA